MAINDFLAGGADLASGLFDIWGLGSAAVKYPFYKLSGHENAFADALQNTWGAQIGQGIRDFNSDLFNSEEDAPGRRAGSTQTYSTRSPNQVLDVLVLTWLDLVRT